MMGKRETLPTIWEIPDDLWERIEPVILELDPPKAKGRKRVPNVQECRYCDITSEDCPGRIDVDHVPEGTSDDF